MVARQGGDEFAILVPAGSILLKTSLADHVLAALAAPYRIGGRSIGVGAGIGTARWPEHGDSARKLLEVADRAQAQGVASIVAALKDAGRPEAHVHLKQHRPWGSFERLAIGDRFQVKRLTVKPGGKLSLQMHYHRSEHWVVVRGTARVTVDTTEQYLRENESVYISATQWHRLENPGKQTLELIEVQIGSYVGEDDIVRSDDIYAREARDAPKTYVNVPESMRK